MKKPTKKRMPAAQRAKISAAMKGRRLTTEHRARIGEGVAGKVLTPEERAERKKAVQAAWAASPAGRKWLAKNQKKKNKARKAWRAKKKAERDAAKKNATDGPSNGRDEPRHYGDDFNAYVADDGSRYGLKGAWVYANAPSEPRGT